MYNVLVFKNRLTVDVEDDFNKAKEFFKSKGIDVVFDFQETDLDVPIKKYTEKWYGIDEYKVQPKLSFDKNKYHCVIFAWDKEGHPLRDSLTSWTNYGEIASGTEFIQLVTAKYDDDIGYIWKSIAHELVHSFFKRLARSGVVLNDPMDETYVLQPDGSYKAISYYKNDDPYAEDGNFSVALALLKPFLDRVIVKKGKYTEILIPSGTLRRSGLKLKDVRYLVAHDTGNAGTTAKQNALYFVNSANEMQASAHFFVDDKDIVLVIPKDEKAFHVLQNTNIPPNVVGNLANDHSIGIELCYGGNIDNFKAYENYVGLFAELCTEYKLNPNTGISSHAKLDPERRKDPLNAFKLIGKGWPWFIVDVATKMEPPKNSLISTVLKALERYLTKKK